MRWDQATATIGTVVLAVLAGTFYNNRRMDDVNRRFDDVHRRIDDLRVDQAARFAQGARQLADLRQELKGAARAPDTPPGVPEGQDLVGGGCRPAFRAGGLRGAGVLRRVCVTTYLTCGSKAGARRVYSAEGVRAGGTCPEIPRGWPRVPAALHAAGVA
jgi:hypothetical protein